MDEESKMDTENRGGKICNVRYILEKCTGIGNVFDTNSLFNFEDAGRQFTAINTFCHLKAFIRTS